MRQRRSIARRSLLSAGIAATTTAILPKVASATRYRWQLISRWDEQFPSQFAAAQRLADRVALLSGGRLIIEVLPPPINEPVEHTLKAVREGRVEMCRSLAYHWRSLSPAFDFFFVAPFGFNQGEMNAWLQYLGGQELWDEAYAPLGVKAFPVGSLGAQSFGWFNRDIDSLADLQGLKFRTTGLGIDIMSQIGVKAVNLPPNQIISAMAEREIEAFELVGPQVDLHFQAYRVASSYYFPSYNQPSGTIELVVNKSKYEALPADLRQVIAIAAQAECDRSLAEAIAGNAQALNTLTVQHGVRVRQLPQDVLMALGKATEEVIAEVRASGDSVTRRTIDSFQNARRTLMAWTTITEQSFLIGRNLR